MEKLHNEIYETLVEKGLCNVCVLRFLGASNSSYFKDVDASLLKLGISVGGDEGDPVVKHLKGNPCVACLGLIQPKYSDDILEKVLKDLKEGGYDSTDFNVAITVPVSTMLREHSIWLFFSDKFPDFVSKKFPAGFLEVGPKDVWKWTFPPALEEKLGKNFNPKSDLGVSLNLEYQDEVKECSCLFNINPNEFSRTKNRRTLGATEMFSRKKVASELLKVTPQVFCKYFKTPPPVPSAPIVLQEVNIKCDPVYIGGRYNKYSRELPQTPWVIDGERKMQTSTEEIICSPIVAFVKGDTYKFTSSGREDVDVRTLGRGRPFSIEIVDSKRRSLTFEELRALENKINETANGKVFVRDLQVTDRSCLKLLKIGEECKRKEYNAFCVLKGPLPPALSSVNEMKEVVIEQRTPLRVLHRRTVASRKRTIHWLRATPVKEAASEEESSYFTLRMSTQAGTYIKEFVHGDFGRTVPCMRDLIGNECDIIALDVQDIDYDWPPSVNYEKGTSSLNSEPPSNGDSQAPLPSTNPDPPMEVDENLECK